MRPGTIALAGVGLAVLVLAGSLVLGMRADGGGATEPAEEESAVRIRVEVLNAAGVPGLARLATERLREAGFDVVFFGNARSFAPESSLVLHRAGSPDAANEVARAIQIPRVESRPDTTLFLEVTVVLGKDWAGAPADSAAADSAESGS